MKKNSVLYWLFGLLFMLPVSGFCQEYQIGVLANRGAAQASKEWKATADFLSAKTGKSFVVVPLDYDQIMQFTKEKKIDFVLTNSAMYAELNKLYGTQAIATQINQYKNQPMDKFGSTILARSDSQIEKLSDLKKKDFACASTSAFGGWLMTVRHLKENGIEPEELASLRTLKTHDNVIYAVLNGAVAAGSVRTGSLEKMVAEGKVKLADFRVIDRVSDDFPLLHSTQLYPEYPMAACQHVPAEIRGQAARAMLSLQATDAAATSAKIVGWREPLDYSPVVECLVQIKYGAFANVAAATPAKTAGGGAAASAPSETAPAKPPVRTVRGRLQQPRTQ